MKGFFYAQLLNFHTFTKIWNNLFRWSSPLFLIRLSLMAPFIAYNIKATGDSQVVRYFLVPVGRKMEKQEGNTLRGDTTV